MRKYVAVFYLLFFTLSFSSVHSQTSDSSLSANVPDLIIRKIILAGNESTDEDIILRELSTKENSAFDPELLKKDLERLNNLGLFNKIDLVPVPTDMPSQIDLMFLFEESIYFLPIPQGGFRNGQLSRFWFGMNIIWRNFRGRNETLAGSFGIGAEPFVGISYYVPWIGEKAHFFSRVSAAYSKNENKSLQTIDAQGNQIPDDDLNYTINNFNVAALLGKFLSREFSVSAGLRFNSIRTSQYEPGRTVSEDGVDEFFTASFIARTDSRNSVDYATSGSYLSAEYSKFGFGNLIDFNRISIDARTFIPIRLGRSYEISACFSTIGAVSFGAEVPSYLRLFFGYDKVIRGHKRLVYEGENQLGFFNEIRFPIIPVRYYSGSSIPAVSLISQLRRMNYKFGIYGTLFFDIGTVWNKNSNFFRNSYHSGFGAGLNYLLPFGLTGRTDFAFRIEDKKFVPQVVFDLNAAF